MVEPMAIRLMHNKLVMTLPSTKVVDIQLSACAGKFGLPTPSMLGMASKAILVVRKRVPCQRMSTWIYEGIK
jgi:hypothetical protein